MTEHAVAQVHGERAARWTWGAAAALPGGSEPMATADYLPVEHAEEAKCAQMFEVIRKFRGARSINFQARAVPEPPFVGRGLSLEFSVQCGVQKVNLGQSRCYILSETALCAAHIWCWPRAQLDSASSCPLIPTARMSRRRQGPLTLHIRAWLRCSLIALHAAI